MHPHTWEIMIEVLSTKENFVQFDRVEFAINKLLEKYQDQFINSIEPFDKVNPTLENIVFYFKKMIEEQVKEYNMILLTIEISETPSRSYIINSYDEVEEKYLSMNKYANDEENFINQIVRKNLKHQKEETDEVAEEVAAADEPEAIKTGEKPADNKTNEKPEENIYDGYTRDDDVRVLLKKIGKIAMVLLGFIIFFVILKNRKIKHLQRKIEELSAYLEENN